MARPRPLIRFEQPRIPDSDIRVRCAEGHDTFQLLVTVRMGGEVVQRFASCAVCAETQPID